jgi:hypothetical protein
MAEFNNGDGKLMSDKMLSFILEYLENETKSTSELVRKLTEMVTNLTVSFTGTPTRKDIYDTIKSVEAGNESKGRDILAKIEAYNRDCELRRKELQEVLEQKKIEVDKNERERFDDLKKFIVTQIEKMEQSQGTHYVDLKELYEKKLISKIESLDTNVTRFMIGLAIAAAAITFILGFLKWGGSIS